MSLKSLVPWHTKMLAKVILSRLPAANAFWHRLDMFSHGAMDKPEYALQVFATHFERTTFARKYSGFVGLEIGPGDSALSAIIARAYGASSCYLVDAGRFATESIEPYRRMAQLLASRGREVPDIGETDSLDDLLLKCGAHYKTEGLASLRELPSSSVDFVWSHAVLEHIRREEFLSTMKELRRVLRADGACSHRVDLQDHLGGQLNNMRLPSSWWERDWIAESGFYTNRLRFSEMLHLFEQAGFAVEIVGTLKWDEVPTKRQALAPEFRHLDESDLRVFGFDVLLRPA